MFESIYLDELPIKLHLYAIVPTFQTCWEECLTVLAVSQMKWPSIDLETLQIESFEQFERNYDDTHVSQIISLTFRSVENILLDDCILYAIDWNENKCIFI